MDEFTYDGPGFVDAGLSERLMVEMVDGERQPTRSTAGAFDYLTGALQTGLALGTTYVSRRMDIDLETRLAGAQPSAAVRRTTQRPVNDHADVTTRAVASVGGWRVGDMLPWLAVAGVAWLFFGKR